VAKASRNVVRDEVDPVAAAFLIISSFVQGPANRASMTRRRQK